METEEKWNQILRFKDYLNQIRARLLKCYKNVSPNYLKVETVNRVQSRIEKALMSVEENLRKNVT